MPELVTNSTFNYGEVVGALAKIHGIGEGTLGAFEARIRHFQRLGVVPASPGKGKRIQYDFAAVFIWAFCLELAEFGIAPEIIKLIVEVHGRSVFIHSPRSGVGDIIFYFAPSFLSADR